MRGVVEVEGRESAPRWSVVEPKALPLSMAGLVGVRACVCVGPPLLGERDEAGAGDADLIVVRAVGQAARAARADEVVGAGGVYRAGVLDVVGGVGGAVLVEVAGDDGGAQQRRAAKRCRCRRPCPCRCCRSRRGCW